MEKTVYNNQCDLCTCKEQIDVQFFIQLVLTNIGNISGILKRAFRTTFFFLSPFWEYEEFFRGLQTQRKSKRRNLSRQLLQDKPTRSYSPTSHPEGFYYYVVKHIYKSYFFLACVYFCRTSYLGTIYSHKSKRL